MNLLLRHITLLALALGAFSARAHIGSPNVFFDGTAGPYPIHVVVRPPGVIPGQAEISVRVGTNDVQRVTVLPIRWNTGKQGAPRPDEATPVRGETNLYSAQLWFMVGGAQSVEIEVAGPAGRGSVVVPVNAIATNVRPMPRGLEAFLASLGVVLVALAASIAGAAVRESGLAAGVPIPRKRRWMARGMVALTAIACAAFLWFGKRWWDAEASDYRNNRLYRPLAANAQVVGTNDVKMLRLNCKFDPTHRNGPLVPDHGKLMHLFLVREPALDAFAHLHPIKRSWESFEAPLPELPPGEYRLYGDVTYETGLSDTITTRISLPAVANGDHKLERDPDDSWWTADHLGLAITAHPKTTALSSNYVMTLMGDGGFLANRETQLRFAVQDTGGHPVPIEHYMGMRGHLILRRDDGSVFTHLHPSGSFSMAAQQLFEMRLAGKAPMSVAPFSKEPICKVPPARAGNEAGEQNELAFPYAFPQPGTYRLWVQTKISAQIYTGVFDVTAGEKQDP